MTSTSGSPQQSPRISTAAIVTHGRVDVHEAEDRLRALAERCGVAIVDEPRDADIEPNGEVAVYLCEQKSLLATLPETTFFSRYRDTFTS